MEHDAGQPEERKRILNIRLKANAQRNARLEYLEALPPTISSYLERCDFLTSPNADDVLPWFLIHPDGVGEQRHRYKPNGYTFLEFGYVNKALITAQCVTATHDQEAAYFWPFEGNPLYCVEFGWVRKNLEALLSWTARTNSLGGQLMEFQPEHLGVIMKDLSAGLVLDNSCGYVEDDPNPDEMIYELAVWGL